MMSPESAEKYKNEFAAVAKDLASKNVSAQASTISAGVEAIGPNDASVAVIMRGTQNAPGKPPDIAVLALRVTLSKDGRPLAGRRRVADQLPLEQAGVLHLQAAIHHHLQAGRLTVARHLLMPQTRL